MFLPISGDVSYWSTWKKTCITIISAWDWIRWLLQYSYCGSAKGEAIFHKTQQPITALDLLNNSLKMNTGRSVLNALLNSESLIKMCYWIKQKLGTKIWYAFSKRKMFKRSGVFWLVNWQLWLPGGVDRGRNCFIEQMRILNTAGNTIYNAFQKCQHWY